MLVLTWQHVLTLCDGTYLCTPGIIILAVASGSWGFGASWGAHWLQLQWPFCLKDLLIAVKEPISNALAAASYGPQWSGKYYSLKLTILKLTMQLLSK